jgi:Tat protein secretion system quality control protein TatD with DNase activity
MKRTLLIDTHCNLPFLLEKLKLLTTSSVGSSSSSLTVSSATASFDLSKFTTDHVEPFLVKHQLSERTRMAAIISVSSDKQQHLLNEQLCQAFRSKTALASAAESDFKTPRLYDVYGIHPLYADQYDDKVEEFLKVKLKEKHSIALGEVC